MNRIVVIAALLTGMLACNQAANEAPEEQVKPKIEYEGVSIVIAEAAKMKLGAALKAAMARGGVEEAVNFCNLNALAITDSVGQRFNATIKRVTDKPRNLANQATPDELKQLEAWRGILASNTGQVVTAVETETARNFYIPIKIDAFCTTCHGVVGKTLSPENEAIIRAKYPNDQATGYEEGDLRGLWHITFAKEQ